MLLERLERPAPANVARKVAHDARAPKVYWIELRPSSVDARGGGRDLVRRDRPDREREQRDCDSKQREATELPADEAGDVTGSNQCAGSRSRHAGMVSAVATLRGYR